ncbi:MAG: hypothetical protein COA67_03595 [Lutibacter sp.]|nr:MAG: hypothetical protein COA67_03595 [Lutibacter sp.]
MGATATDLCDDDIILTGNIVIDISAVNVNLVGSYFVTYDVTDSDTNVAVQVTRTVNVLDTTAPTFTVASDQDVNMNGSCQIVIPDVTNTDSDCSSVTVTQSPVAGTLVAATHNTPINITVSAVDGAGNSAASTQTVVLTPKDVTAPDTPILADVTGQCTATATTPTTTDNCGTITGTTSDPLTYSTQGAHIITWNFDDGNGNNINVTQTVFINDNTDPIAVCQDITVQLDNTTGLISITPAQVDNGSTDNCGSITMTLSQSTFDCTDIGTNAIILTVDDGNGNIETCISNVTITSPNIDGGILAGYLTNTETAIEADDLVAVTACPEGEIKNAQLNLTGYSGTITSWESSIDGGLNWITIANTSNAYTYTNITQTTLVRTVIEIGSCQATSSIVLLAVIPPNIPPTISGATEFDLCLGASATVVATSSFGTGQYIQNGDFQTGQLNTTDPDGWLVDGTIGGYTASANNTSSNHWAGTNPKKFPKTIGIRYDSGAPKFAIATGNITTVLETPIVNSFGLDDFSFGFDQAYNLLAGDQILIELSLDGGSTYNVTLQDIVGPAQSALFDTFAADNTLFDLDQYLGLANIRIRFTFIGTNAHSAWALDNFEFPDSPIDEVIQWTDEDGNVITTGSTVTITPITPGIQEYGVTSLINSCRATGDEGTVFVTSNVSFSYAGESIITAAGECGKSAFQLAAYDNTLTALQNFNNGVWNNNYVVPDIIAGDTDYPGTNENGFWSITATPIGYTGTASFSDINSTNSMFNADDEGTYMLSWTVAGCLSSINVTVENCDSVDFDGIDDNITFKNDFDFGSDFSIEIWVKPSVTNANTQTIISKRADNIQTTGYDIRIVNDKVSFNWNNGNSIISPNDISTDKWYHIAVTYGSSTYKLYIDGIEVVTSSSGASLPTSNNHDCIVGAMDQSLTSPFKPVNYFNGWLDELKIWDLALNKEQVRQMMNQELEINGAAVSGKITTRNISGLNWSNLEGYYQMNQGFDVLGGFITPNAGTVNGKLRNITTWQEETAPIPYTTVRDGNWTSRNLPSHATNPTPWLWGHTVWNYPNGTGVNGDPIDWNIVVSSHNIHSGDKNITVSGLISNSGELTIESGTNNGQMLWVTDYLLLNGKIDLVGESQLIQKRYSSSQIYDSELDTNSTGLIERDQQGIMNSYAYNYWSLPVSKVGTGNNNPVTISEVLNDGTDPNNPVEINFGGTSDYYYADGALTSPVRVASAWIWKFVNDTNAYAQWEFIGSNTGTINTTEGYTMKGVDGGGTVDLSVLSQNYVFEGKPNNATDISYVIGDGELVHTTFATPADPLYPNISLTGNPFPSALEFNKITLYNYIGQTIRIWTKNLEETRTNLPYGELSIGAYILKIDTEQGTISKKIIIE